MRRMLARVAIATGAVLAAVATAGVVILGGAVTAATVAGASQTAIDGTATVEPIDPTVSYAMADQSPTYPACAPLGLHFALVTVHGARTLTYAGCLNAAHPFANDSFTTTLPAMLAAASKG